MEDLVTYSYEQGKRVLERKLPEILKKHGQFLTPPTVARYMAKQMGSYKNGDVLLEPACGSGVLVCAVIERLITEKNPLEISITVYETDKELCDISREILGMASKEAKEARKKLKEYKIKEQIAKLEEKKAKL